MYPHVIRLRKPWDIQWPGDGAALLAHCTRRFNRPSGLFAGEAVWLVFSGPTLAFTAWLNESPLTLLECHSAMLQANVTRQLAASNLLRLDFAQPTASDDAAGFTGATVANDGGGQPLREIPQQWLEQVALEIRLDEPG